MTTPVRAVYEAGTLRLLDPLDLDEHAVVRISVEPDLSDGERAEWLEQNQRILTRVWDNEADDIYNVLLTQ
jgi:predicted DNA-binding antitoxin AbrB/MazE fold protein